MNKPAPFFLATICAIALIGIFGLIWAVTQ